MVRRGTMEHRVYNYLVSCGAHDAAALLLVKLSKAAATQVCCPCSVVAAPCGSAAVTYELTAKKCNAVGSLSTADTDEILTQPGRDILAMIPIAQQWKQFWHIHAVAAPGVPAYYALVAASPSGDVRWKQPRADEESAADVSSPDSDATATMSNKRRCISE